MKQLSWTAENLDDVGLLGECLASAIQSHLANNKNLVICLDGILGAGKTTLTSSICQQLGVPADQISSPTFSLQNIYRFELFEESIQILHFDFYRIADEDELLETGFDEAITERGVYLIEWSNRFPQMLPEDCLYIEIGHLSKNEREFKIRTLCEDLFLEIRRYLDSKAD